MCNVNQIKKRVGEKLVLVQNGSQRMNSIYEKVVYKVPPPFQRLHMKKIFRCPGELFRPSVCCKDMRTDSFFQR